MIAFTPDGQLQLERAIAAAVVVDLVLEGLWFFGNESRDPFAHRRKGPVAQHPGGAVDSLGAMAVVQRGKAPDANW